MQIANIFLLMESVSIDRPRGNGTGVSKDLRGIQRNGGEGGGGSCRQQSIKGVSYAEKYKKQNKIFRNRL